MARCWVACSDIFRKSTSCLLKLQYPLISNKKLIFRYKTYTILWDILEVKYLPFAWHATFNCFSLPFQVLPPHQKWLETAFLFTSVIDINSKYLSHYFHIWNFDACINNQFICLFVCAKRAKSTWFGFW